MIERAKTPQVKTYITAILTVVFSIAGAWTGMNARLYEVEAKIRLIEAQTKNLDKNEDAIQQIQLSLVRIEGKLDSKQDRFK
jgi:hypothetical protein